MGLSLIDVIKEGIRQGITSDSTYALKLPYAFKLCTQPMYGPTGALGTAWFPLPINPETFKLEWDFAKLVTPTQDGGVVVERGGIVLGRMTLTAFTGLTLRKCKDTSVGAGSGVMTGTLGRGGGTLQEISGQMAAWRLVHRCFDAYGELCKDELVADKTWMEFHSLKDKFDVTIEPTRFSLRRDKGDATRIGYTLDIEADIIGNAKPPTVLEASSDSKSILDGIMDTVANLRTAVSLVTATIQDLTAAADAIKRKINNIAGILSDVQSVVTAVTDFLEGTKSFVDIPADFLSATADAIDAGHTLIETYTDDDAWMGCYEKMKHLSDQVDAIRVGIKGHLKEDYDAAATAVAGINDKAKYIDNATGAMDRAAAAKAAGAAAGGAMSLATAFASEFSPGDYDSLRASSQVPSVTPGKYTGVKEVYLKQGDTLQSLALQYLGKAAAWIDLALVNQLQSPFISSSNRPNTLAPGDPIQIPVSSATAPIATVTTGAAPGESQIEDRFGTDIRLQQQSNKRYSWAIDVGHGSTDFLRIFGIDNLVQGLEKRFRWEYGTVPSAPAVGLPRLVGANEFSSSYTEARYAIRQQVEADPRIKELLDETFEASLNTIRVVIRAIPIGYDTARTVPLQLT